MRFKLTSPGVLLILATLAAGGIFLLDLFYLRPHFQSHQQAAFQELAARTNRSATMALRDDQNVLCQICAAWAEHPDLRRILQSGPSGAAEFERFAQEAFSHAQVEHVWLCDASGRIVQAWQRFPAPPAGDRQRREAQLASAAAELAPLKDAASASGLIRLPQDVGLFARQAVHAGQDDHKLLGYLVLVHDLNCGVLEHVRSAVDAEVVLVVGEELPHTAPWWMTAGDTLALAWPALAPDGQPVGYFHAKLPVKQAHLQFVGSRRMILIVLSLSVGLVLLIVLGTHMLITGPLVRLLSRLQRMESGHVATEELTRSLHGEPLVLARRLEVAFDKLAHMSKTDALTSLPNRRHFEQVLEAFYHQARRYNRRLSLMVLDIDFFKAINDAGGHQAGDEVLRRFAKTIESACRKADLPARLGGDEFAVLMPETSAREAASLAERIRSALSRGPIKIKSLELKLNTSIGVTDLNVGEINTSGKMLALADRALYAAKDLGRNRVVLAHDLEGTSLRSAARRNRLDMLWQKLAGLDTQLKDLFVQAMADIYKVLQHRDSRMAGHARNVQRYAVLIAREMELPASMVQRIHTAAIMHDIGLLAMPDSVLLCPGPLDEEQWRTMREHPLLSVQIMESMQFLEQEIPAVRYHHERFDGKGYPEGIAGAAIPLSARVLAVADSFDAMTSDRSFRSAKSKQQALDELRQVSGSQLDPAVVEAFLAVAGRLGDRLMNPSAEDLEEAGLLDGHDPHAREVTEPISG